MKTKTPTGVIISVHPTHLSEPIRRFLRGILVFVLALGSLIALSARGQTNYTGAYYFNTFAGNALDGAGNVYVTDFSNPIRKITPAGVVTTLAGTPGRPRERRWDRQRCAILATLGNCR